MPCCLRRIRFALFVQEAAQEIGAGRVAQFTQRFCLNLANTLTGYIELLAHFFQCVVGVHVDAKTHAQHLGFPGGEAGENILGKDAERKALKKVSKKGVA